MKKTFLFQEHEALGAKFVDFHGWQLPIQYSCGALEEHLQVREKAGLFDISHMGRVFIEGLESAAFLDSICSQSIIDMDIDQVRYGVLIDVDGQSIDDVLIYRHQQNHFSCVVNGANREKDLEFLTQHAKNFEVSVRPHFDRQGILALQGPLSLEVLHPLFPGLKDLKFMRGQIQTFQGKEIYLSRTGYTGERGYEFYGDHDTLRDLWHECMIHKEVHPIGLAARDSLRLEMGYVLFGNDLSSTIYVNESLAAWTLKWERDFLGKKALEEVEKSSQKRKAYGVLLKQPGVARAHMKVYQAGTEIGVVTSGGYSPGLKKSIALILVQPSLNEQENIQIEIRNKQVEAEISSLPFYKK